MPMLPNPLKRHFPLIKPSSPFPSRPLSSTPTPDDVAHLILQQKTPDQALSTYRWASRLPSFHHGPATHAAVIRALASFRRFDAAQRFLLHDVPSPAHDSALLPLVRALSRAGRPKDALHLLDQLSSRSLPAHNAILDALVKQDIDAARRFFRSRITRLPNGGDERTFGILMKGLCRTNRIAEAFKLLQLIKKRGLPPNPVFYNTLIHSLCRNGSVGRARSLMAEMPTTSDVTFNILISAYCNEGNLVQALVMLEKSFDSGLVPDKIAVTKIVELLSCQGRAMEAVEVLERVEKRGGVVDVVAYNTLIKGFCRADKPQLGIRMLREMESKGCLPNVRTYNALIAGFCDSGKLDSAMDMFDEMKTDGIDANSATFETLVHGLCSGGRIGDGLKILAMMEEQNRGGVSAYNSVLYGLYRECRLDEAHAFLDRMASSFPTAVERTVRIQALCNEGNVDEAKLIYDQMIGEGGLPSAIVYSHLIEAMCGAGNVRQAFDLMNEMVGKRLFPVVSTFNAMICGFCKEGEFRSAAKLIDEMVGRGCSPDASSYNYLIGSFCKTGEFGRAVGFLQKMVERNVMPDRNTWEYLLVTDALWAKVIH